MFPPVSGVEPCDGVMGCVSGHSAAISPRPRAQHTPPPRTWVLVLRCVVLWCMGAKRL